MGLCRGNIGIMEKNMEITMMGLYGVYGFEDLVVSLHRGTPI